MERRLRVLLRRPVEDLTHNFFLETGARNNKLKVYEMVEHPAARALTGYLLVRGGVHQVAYARALENLTGADLMKLFPSPRIPTDLIPECQPHIERGEHLKLYRFSPDDYQEIAAVFNGPHPETGEELTIADEISPEGAPPYDLPSQTAVFAPGPDPEMIAESRPKLRRPPVSRPSRPEWSPTATAKAAARPRRPRPPPARRRPSRRRSDARPRERRARRGMAASPVVCQDCARRSPGRESFATSGGFS